MKNRQSFKIFFLILAVLFLSIYLSSCVIFIPTQPIVEINITNDNWTYDIYVDGNYFGKTDTNGNVTFSNITPGYHHFEAFESPSLLGRYGEKWKNITSGYNIVNIVTN